MEEKTLKQELVTIQKEAGDIVSRATNFQLASDKHYEKATQVISWIAGVLKRIEVMRLFHTKKLNEQVKSENELHKGYAKPFKEARDIMDNKMLSHRRKQQEKINAENERIRKEAEIVAKKEKISVEEVMASTEPKEVAKTVGTSTVKKRWTFRVIDGLKVERIYLKIDEVKINGDIRKGIREMKGIEIFEEEIISTR